MKREKRKKQQFLKRIGSYLLVISLVLIIVPIAVFFALGYRFDLSQQKIEQLGFVQYDSNIRGANVSIDGASYKSKTAGKSALPENNYTFTFSLKGYRDWKATHTIAAGTLTWLNYARFVPNEITTEGVASFPTLSGALASDDNKKIITQESSDKPVFNLINITDKAIQKRAITLSSDKITQPKENSSQKFELQTWSGNSRFVLIKHEVNSIVEWLVLDTNDGSYKNISQILSVSITKIVFGGGNGIIFYAQMDDNSLRKIDLSGNTLSAPIATNTLDFSYRNDAKQLVIIAKSDDNKKILSLYDEDSAKNLAFKTYPEDEQLDIAKIARAHYDNHDYLGIATGKTVSLYEIVEPENNSDTTIHTKMVKEFTLKEPVTHLDFSVDARFLLAQSNSSLQTFDFFYNQLTENRAIPQNSGDQKLDWLDSFHPYISADGKLTMIDFDGQNQQLIVSYDPQFGATLSQNGTYIYSFAKNDKGYTLQRSTMVLP